MRTKKQLAKSDYLQLKIAHKNWHKLELNDKDDFMLLIFFPPQTNLYKCKSEYDLGPILTDSLRVNIAII